MHKFEKVYVELLKNLSLWRKKNIKIHVALSSRLTGL